MYKDLPIEFSVRLIINSGYLLYSNKAVKAPNKLNIEGNNFNHKLIENSASTRTILLGCINKEFPKKSEPIPVNKSEKI